MKDLRGGGGAGLVEVEIELGQVVLRLCPPGRQPVQVLMPPDQSRALADGLLQASEEIEAGHGHQS